MGGVVLTPGEVGTRELGPENETQSKIWGSGKIRAAVGAIDDLGGRERTAQDSAVKMILLVG